MVFSQSPQLAFQEGLSTQEVALVQLLDVFDGSEQRLVKQDREKDEIEVARVGANFEPGAHQNIDDQLGEIGLGIPANLFKKPAGDPQLFGVLGFKHHSKVVVSSLPSNFVSAILIRACS